MPEDTDKGDRLGKQRIVKSLANQIEYENEIYIKRICGEIVMTDQYRLYKCLSKHLGHLSIRRNWTTPFGILVTIMITSATSTFKPFLGIGPALWSAIFIFAGLVAFFWLVLSSWRDFKSKNMENLIEEIIVDVKKN